MLKFIWKELWCSRTMFYGLMWLNWSFLFGPIDKFLLFLPQSLWAKEQHFQRQTMRWPVLVKGYFAAVWVDCMEDILDYLQYQWQDCGGAFQQDSHPKNVFKSTEIWIWDTSRMYLKEQFKSHQRYLMKLGSCGNIKIENYYFVFFYWGMGHKPVESCQKLVST